MMMNSEELLKAELQKITSTPLGRRAFLGILPFLLMSCATSPKSRYREGDNTGQTTSLTLEDEEKMAREYIPKMRKQYPSYKNSYAQDYIKDLGEDIVQSNNLAANPYNYSFEIVESEHINAFALPAGTIFVTRPLVQMSETEAELAGVIGHEIGHVKARHTAERIDLLKREERKSLLYGLGGAIVGGAAGFGLGKLLCGKKDRECLARIASYGALAGSTGGLLIQRFAFMAHSREDEMEADRIGFKMSTKAGHHPGYVGNFYTKLLEMEQQYQKNQNALSKAFVDAMSTHPPSRERAIQIDEMKKNVLLKKGKITSPSFKKVKKIVTS